MFELLLAAIIGIGDCVMITQGPFTGHKGLIYGERDDRLIVRFCDSEMCIQVPKKVTEIRLMPSSECDSIQ